MSQIKIVFTKKAIYGVSDFDAEYEIKKALDYINYCIANNISYTYDVCNMLVHTMLRAAYYTTHKHLQEHTTWWYEDEQIQVTNKMCIEDINFWRHSVTCLEEKALEKLFDL